MSFYEPEVFLNATELDAAKSGRVLQWAWDLIKDGREDSLRSPLFPPLLGILFYLIVTGFLTLVDLAVQDLPLARKYRFQKERKVTWKIIKSAMANLWWNHLLFIFPMATVQALWVPPTPLPPVAPTLWDFCSQQVAFFFLFDFYYWAWHSFHHKVRFLYRAVHSIHHQYSAPFALATQYLHPWEIFSVGMGISIIPWFFRPHCMTYWSWFIVANWVSIEVHLGYDLPFAAHHWIPIYGGAPSHDLHHMRPLTNFEPWLNYLDKLAGWKLTHKGLAEMKKQKAQSIGVHPKEDVKGLPSIN